MATTKGNFELINREIQIINELNISLHQFSGTENYYKIGFSDLKGTDGIQYVRDKFNCYWLFSICDSVRHLPKIKNESFILWQIVKTGTKATVKAKTDSNGKTLYTQKIEYTDFPLSVFEFYQCDNVLLLKSEY